jgi:hypothetical protein
VTWVAVGTLAVTAITSYQANSANNKAAAKNGLAAIQAQTYENRGLNEQTREQGEVDSDRKLEAMKEALKAKGTIQAQAKNVTGSTEGTSQEITNNLGNFLSQIQANQDSRGRALENSKRGTSAQATDRINSMPKTKYNPTADLAKAGLSIYGGYKADGAAAKAGGFSQPSFGDYAYGRDWKK